MHAERRLQALDERIGDVNRPHIPVDVLCGSVSGSGFLLVFCLVFTINLSERSEREHLREKDTCGGQSRLQNR